MHATCCVACCASMPKFIFLCRYDVVDCHVCFCSPEVLASLSEEVDWNDMRNDFIRGTLVDDMHGYKLFAHVIQGQYAGRVKCLSSYDSVSKDITARWAYPIVPDANCFSVFDSARGCMTPQSYVILAQLPCRTFNFQQVLFFSSQQISRRRSKIGTNLQHSGCCHRLRNICGCKCPHLQLYHWAKLQDYGWR